jgi:energy-coupling factor transporter ATP-binding protein EcfA2
MNIVDIKGLSYTYPGTSNQVLRDINLTIHEGEFLAVMGPTGAGKSTLCLTLNGIIPHSMAGKLEGDIVVAGMNTRMFLSETLSTKVGMVFQEPEGQLFCMTVEEEVAFGPENLAIPREEIKKRVDWALDVVRMRDFRDRFPINLSGGQKQRVAIAAGLSMRPEIFVLDEPTSGLDPIGKMEVFSVVKDLKENSNMTIVMVENESERVADFADRVIVISEGRVFLEGTPRQVLVDKSDDLKEVGILPPQVSDLSMMLNRNIPGSEYSFLNLKEAESGITKLLEPR